MLLTFDHSKGCARNCKSVISLDSNDLWLIIYGYIRL
jgi:hypothetical protein